MVESLVRNFAAGQKKSNDMRPFIDSFALTLESPLQKQSASSVDPSSLLPRGRWSDWPSPRRAAAPAPSSPLFKVGAAGPLSPRASSRFSASPPQPQTSNETNNLKSNLCHASWRLEHAPLCFARHQSTSFSAARGACRFNYAAAAKTTWDAFANHLTSGDAVIRVFTVSPKIRMLALVPHTGTLDRSWTCHLGIPLRRAIPCRRRLNLGRVRSDLVVSDGEERPFRVSTRSGSRRAQENTRVRH
ncbi:hypothetical protein IWX46DRAFT_336449 [Phyllosticta citricarpa]|uniref:Uncharacterized protein n=1 Tax=Phyllosticta citricarpa TaxID=55181 RepID=A0ABR1LFM4_9PEZI